MALTASHNSRSLKQPHLVPGDKELSMSMQAPALALRSRAHRSVAAGSLAVSLVWMAASWSARATQPKINWIQFNPPNLVLLHFETDANRAYEIQYIDYAPTNGATWSVLAPIPLSGSPEHYVWPDFLPPSIKQRFYRLQAAP
jgi:hypothetical protein